jgi:hypothetical protein
MGRNAPPSHDTADPSRKLGGGTFQKNLWQGRKILRFPVSILLEKVTSKIKEHYRFLKEEKSKASKIDGTSPHGMEEKRKGLGA